MTPLIGKPPHSGVVFDQHIEALNAPLSFRSLDLTTDLPLLHRWVNASYAKRFWQLSGSEAMLHSVYAAVLANPSAHAFLGLLNGQPFCQVDAYAIAADEVAEHVEVGAGDAGMHVLMCPPRELQAGWSKWAIRCFQQYYFSFEAAQRLFAEPDRENYAANKLAINTGFRFCKTIELSYKTANLYMITREDFFQH